MTLPLVSQVQPVYSRLCVVCLFCCRQIISQTLSPTWNQCLPMSRLLVGGDLQHIQREPPRIVIEVYDDDALVLDDGWMDQSIKSWF